MEKLKSIADIMLEISNRKNGTVNTLPKEHEALINQLTEDGQLAAVALMVNKEVKEIASKTFLGTFQGITVESIMLAINQRTRK